MQETKLVLLTADLAGYARAAAHEDALTIAGFLDRWYHAAAATLRAQGGRIVKFMGDAVLAVFPETSAIAAIDAAAELRVQLSALRGTWRVDLSVNVHLAIVADGELGPADDRRYDVLGTGVNHLFLMGGGAGIRISEPVFRQLPTERRDAWSKYRPAATYSLR
jgi:adenylate cyclase